VDGPHAPKRATAVRPHAKGPQNGRNFITRLPERGTTDRSRLGTPARMRGSLPASSLWVGTQSERRPGIEGDLFGRAL
jgi:hypothetical protein